MALETLRKLLNDQIRITERTNLVQSKKFREALEDAMVRYPNRAITTAEMISRLIDLAKHLRSIAERVDALAAMTLPALQRCVKWGMAFYGVGDGWCFSCGGFAGHVKLTFGRGTSLTPVPPVTPIGMGKDSRGVDLESVDDLDEHQVASWMTQATAIPGFGGKKR